jgi:hypothetical protein
VAETVAYDDPQHDEILPVRRHRVGGDNAVLGLSWTSLWCTEPVMNDRIRLSLPHNGGTVEVDGFGGSPACNGDPGSGPTPIVIAPFQPQDFIPQEVTSPYANVNVQLEGPASVRAGSRFSFEVVLTARRAVSSQEALVRDRYTASW